MRFYVKVIQFVQCLGTNIRIFIAYGLYFGLFNKGKALRTWVWKAGRKDTTIHQGARNRTPFLPIVEAKSTMLASPYRSNFSMLSPFSQSDSN